jgi:hypothetical protein
MPDCLDVAVQRKLIADLEQHGRSTQEAESRLRAMLETMASFRRSGPEAEYAKFRPRDEHAQSQPSTVG